MVVVVVEVPSDTTRTGFNRRRREVGLDCSETGKEGREGEHCQVTLKQRASKGCEGIDRRTQTTWNTRMGSTCGKWKGDRKT